MHFKIYCFWSYQQDWRHKERSIMYFIEAHISVDWFDKKKLQRNVSWFFITEIINNDINVNITTATHQGETIQPFISDEFWVSIKTDNAVVVGMTANTSMVHMDMTMLICIWKGRLIPMPSSSVNFPVSLNVRPNSVISPELATLGGNLLNFLI